MSLPVDEPTPVEKKFATEDLRVTCLELALSLMTCLELALSRMAKDKDGDIGHPSINTVLSDAEALFQYVRQGDRGVANK